MPASEPEVNVSQLNTLIFKSRVLQGLLSLPLSWLPASKRVYEKVLWTRSSRRGQVPVYDARRVLAGTAIVEILAGSIKVAPARQSICRINLRAKVPGDSRCLLTPSRSVALPLPGEPGPESA